MICADCRARLREITATQEHLERLRALVEECERVQQQAPAGAVH